MNTPVSTDLIRRWIIDHHRRTGEHPTASTPGGRWAEAEDHLRGLGTSLDAMVRAMRVGGWFGPEPKAADPASSPTFAGVGWAEARATLGPEPLDRDDPGPIGRLLEDFARRLQAGTYPLSAAWPEGAGPGFAAVKPGPGSEGPFAIIFTAGDKILAEFPPPEGDGFRASRAFDLASVKVDVSCGPIDLILEIAGPTYPDFLAMRAALFGGLPPDGACNDRDWLGIFGPTTVKLLDVTFGPASPWDGPRPMVYAPGPYLMRYRVAYREGGWPDAAPADFSTLYPGGPVPQEVLARAECDVFARAGKDGKPAFLARYRSDEAVLIGEIEADS